jgi:hypothetical protein
MLDCEFEGIKPRQEGAARKKGDSRADANTPAPHLMRGMVKNCIISTNPDFARPMDEKIMVAKYARMDNSIVQRMADICWEGVTQ